MAIGAALALTSMPMTRVAEISAAPKVDPIPLIAVGASSGTKAPTGLSDQDNRTSPS